MILLCISCVSAADNITDNSNLMSDSINIYEIDSSSNLQSAIDSNYGNSIKLEKDYKFDDTSSAVDIKDSITIDGGEYKLPSHTIDAKGQPTIFNIIGNNVVLKNMVITGASNTAIKITGSNVTLSNIFFYNNSGEYGGAVSVNGENATIIGGYFSNNEASEGGAILVMRSNVKITDNLFDNNSGGLGASISLERKASNAFIEKCTFSNNEAIDGAGVVSFANDMKVINCNFNNNEAHAGAGICLSGNNADIINSTFTSNHAWEGQAVFTKGHNTEIRDCEFKNNARDGEPESSSVESKTCDTIISNAKFVDNTN